MPSSGTAAEAEARRRLAVQRVADGWTQAAVASFVGVHPVTVGWWVARFRAGARPGWRPSRPRGGPGSSPPDEEKRVLGWLADPPTRYGFRTDLWTARRVADLIERRLKVTFHPHYLREWLRKRNYTPQRPARRANQQDPAEVGRWVQEEWPRVQKKLRPSTPTSC